MAEKAPASVPAAAPAPSPPPVHKPSTTPGGPPPQLPVPEGTTSITGPPPEAPSRTLAPTGTLVEQLWHAGGEGGDLDGWDVSHLGPDPSSARHWIWRAGIGLVLVATTVLSIWYAAAWQENRSLEAADETRAAAVSLTEASAQLEESVADLADGHLDRPQQLTTSLAQLDTAARRLFNRASELSTSPTGGAGLRTQAIGAAQQALELESGLGDAVAYGTAATMLLATPDLPTAADGEQLATVAGDVTGWVTEVQEGVASLPSHPLLETHREQLAAFAEGLERRQTAYLDALRRGDELDARRELAALDADLADLRSGWQEAAEDVSAWAADALSVLDRRLSEIATRGG